MLEIILLEYDNLCYVIKLEIMNIYVNEYANIYQQSMKGVNLLHMELVRLWGGGGAYHVHLQGERKGKNNPYMY